MGEAREGARTQTAERSVLESRVRARNVEVSSSTAHPIGEPTGAHPRVRAYGGGAAQRRLWGVRDRSRKQLSVCLMTQVNSASILVAQPKQAVVQPKQAVVLQTP